MIFMVRIFFPALLLFIMAACGSESRSAHTDGDLDFSESDTETSDGDGENTELPENESDGDFVIGAELDIFPYVSLYASRTLTDVLPWPRESSDAVATLRGVVRDCADDPD